MEKHIWLVPVAAMLVCKLCGPLSSVSCIKKIVIEVYLIRRCLSAPSLSIFLTQSLSESSSLIALIEASCFRQLKQPFAIILAARKRISFPFWLREKIRGQVLVSYPVVIKLLWTIDAIMRQSSVLPSNLGYLLLLLWCQIFPTLRWCSPLDPVELYRV